jgi:hypothetical protein
MTPPMIGEDIILACADLAARSGARDFEVGYLHEDAATPEEAGWFAQATWQGARIATKTEHPSPQGAALELAHRLLNGATCRCGQPVTLTDDTPGCRWQLTGKRWESGCDAPPIKVEGQRGDVAAMNRAARRAHRRKP